MSLEENEIDMIQTTDLKARYAKKYSPKKYSKRKYSPKKYSKKRYSPKKYSKKKYSPKKYYRRSSYG